MSQRLFVILFTAYFYTYAGFSFDVDYFVFNGLKVDEALGFFEPKEEDFYGDSDDEQKIGFKEKFDSLAPYSNSDGSDGSGEEEDDDEDYWLYSDMSDDEFFLEENFDDISDIKAYRRQKLLRDKLKDQPYQKKYIESIKNVDPLTKKLKRQFYDEARENYLMDKLSIQKAKHSYKPKTSRRQRKIYRALLKNKIIEKESSNELCFPMTLNVVGFIFDSKICHKSLYKSNAWQKQSPEVIVDKRIQDAKRPYHNKKAPSVLKLNYQKKPGKKPSDIGIPNSQRLIEPTENCSFKFSLMPLGIKGHRS